MIVTHSGRFHADEVFATAMILLIEPHQVVRSRDDAVIETGQYVLDVGGVYDAEQGRFDHHQNSFSDSRENGIPFATAGLVWRHFGQAILRHFGANDSQIDYAQNWVDNKLVMDIDALDNGLYLDSERPSVSMLVGMMNQNTEDEAAQLTAFLEAVEFASAIFKRFILASIEQAQAAQDFEAVATYLEDGLVLLSQAVSYKDLIKNRADIRRVVYPKGQEGYGVYCNGTENHLPLRFRGLREAELQSVSALPDAVFCHKSGFMAVCKTLESALVLAKSH